MANRSDLQSIFQENPSLLKRQQLLQQLEEALSKALSENIGTAAYISNTLNPAVAAATAMNITHIVHVEDIIRTACAENVSAVALMLESLGGDATFPLEVIKRVKKYCSRFYTIVVSVAKSAGTLLSMLSDKVIALDTASFGPVDPQIVITTPQGPQVVSARQIKEMIESTIPSLIKNLSPAERAAVLATQNYVLYQQALDSLKLVKEIIDSQLGGRLAQEQINAVKKKLIEAPLSHGINITVDDLGSFGLDVLKVKANSELGLMLLEYHRRALKSLIAEAQGGQGLILFESKKASFQIVGIQLPPIPAGGAPQRQQASLPEKRPSG